MTDENIVAAMDQLTEQGILDLSKIDAQGNWTMDIQDDHQVQQLLMDDRLTARQRDLLERRINAEVNLRNLQDAAQMDRLMRQHEQESKEGGLDRTQRMTIESNRLNENKRQFDDNLGRLEELDKWNKKFDKKQLREMARQREATVGGYGTSSLSWVPVIGGWLEDSAFEFNQDQRLFLQEQQMIGMDLQQQEFDFLKQYRQGQNWIAARNQELQSQWRMGQIDQQRYESNLDALSSMQTNYGELFGGSKEGIMQGLLTNQALLDSYANGTLDADQTNMVNTMLIELSTPYSKWDPADSTVTYYTPGANLPNAIMEALNTREQNGLPAPIGAKRSGLNIPGMQAGGDPGWAAFRERITPRDPDMIEPIPGGGAIVDETLSFEQASGPPRAWKGTVNVIGDTVRDITGVGGPPYSEIDKVGEQLTAVANQTQRFIRDSVAGRPFAIEIEQMAEEIAKPGVFRMDEQNLIKLQTMRSQLKEIQGIATSILERPQGFDRKTIVAARQDLTQIAPLIENYDRIIRSYEMELCKIDKPDPAMFERSPYNPLVTRRRN